MSLSTEIRATSTTKRCASSVRELLRRAKRSILCRPNEPSLSNINAPVLADGVDLSNLLQSNWRHLSTSTWTSWNEHFNQLKFYVCSRDQNVGFSLTRRDRNAVVGSGGLWLCIDTVTTQQAWQAGLRPGDCLESVNGVHMNGSSPEQAMRTIRTGSAPCVCRFVSVHKAMQCQRDRFELTLRYDKLGVSFLGDGAEGIPIVVHVASQTHASLAGVSAGNVLVGVNDMDAVALGFHRAMAYLKTAPRPVTLIFQRVSNRMRVEHNAREPKQPQYTAAEYEHQTELRRSMRQSMLATQLVDEASVSEQMEDQEDPDDEALPEPEDEEEDEVVIVWRYGPLGLTLFEDPISGLALVNRLTGRGVAIGIDRIQHGDHLEIVNGNPTEGTPFKQLCMSLTSTEKPLILTFKRLSKTAALSCERLSGAQLRRSLGAQAQLRQSTSFDHDHNSGLAARALGASEYEVSWTTPRLGLVFSLRELPSSSATKSEAFIKHIRPDCSLDLQSIAEGDTLLSINNVSATDVLLDDVRLLFLLTAKPAVLRFRRERSSPADDVVPPHHMSFMSMPLSLSELESLDEEHHESYASSPALTYMVEWNMNEQLGVTFASYQDANRGSAVVVYVSRVLADRSASAQAIAVGDRLVSINGERLRPDQSFRDTMHALGSRSKALLLGFERPMIEHTSVSDTTNTLE